MKIEITDFRIVEEAKTFDVEFPLYFKDGKGLSDELGVYCNERYYMFVSQDEGYCVCFVPHLIHNEIAHTVKIKLNNAYVHLLEDDKHKSSTIEFGEALQKGKKINKELRQIGQFKL